MSAPPPPRSRLGNEGVDDVEAVARLMVLAAAGWEAGWLAMSVAGANPRGQIGVFPARFGAWLAGHSAPGGWVAVAWAPARPVSLVPVVLVWVVLAVAAAAVLHLSSVWRQGSRTATSPSRSRGRWGWRLHRRSGGGGRPNPAGAERNTSLRDFLDRQANGEDD